MGEKTKRVLGGAAFAVIAFATVWIIWDLSVAIFAVAIYFAGWLISPPRFWKILGVVGLAAWRFVASLFKKKAN